MEVVVKRYDSACEKDWATVLSDSKNGLFLHERAFIEYHGNRFNEMSAIAYVKGEPVAILPAAFDEGTAFLTSHPGLTFGGVLLKRELRSNVSIAVIDAMLDSFRSWGATSCLIKLVPQAFMRYPAAELDYALWRRGFSLSRRDLSSLLPLDDSLPFNYVKRRSAKSAQKDGIVVSESSIAEFHSLLESVLMEHHGVTPVHTRKELELLQGKFPSRIFVRSAHLTGVLLAGALVFNYGHIWHTQYLASSAAGRGAGALDLVISEIKREAAASGAKYLSFGASTESGGTILNEGLLWQKESFGARCITHDFMVGEL